MSQEEQDSVTLSRQEYDELKKEAKKGKES